MKHPLKVRRVFFHSKSPDDPKSADCRLRYTDQFQTQIKVPSSNTPMFDMGFVSLNFHSVCQNVYDIVEQGRLYLPMPLLARFCHL